MKKVVYSLIVIIIILSSIIIFLFSNDFFPSNSPPDSSSCKTIINNGENKINIVFLSSENNAIRFSDYLFEVEPYKSMKDSFNVFYIDNPINCEVYKGVALLCYSKNNVKLASSCPNDFVIAVKDDYDSSVRSSTYMNFVTINSAHQSTVVPHEFSHALANLADEYVPATIPKGSSNCASSCQDFDSEFSCYSGCSKDDYFRAYDYGIMRSLTASSFGDFDSNLIIVNINNQLSKSSGGSKKNLLTGKATGEIDTSCSDKEYYLVQGHFSSEKLIVDSKSRQTGCFGNNGVGGFDYELILDNGELYLDGNFNPELIITEHQETDEETISGEHFSSDVSFFLKIPIIPNSKSLIISHGEEQLTNIALNDENSRFCKI